MLRTQCTSALLSTSEGDDVLYVDMVCIYTSDCCLHGLGLPTWPTQLQQRYAPVLQT